MPYVPVSQRGVQSKQSGYVPVADRQQTVAAPAPQKETPPQLSLAPLQNTTQSSTPMQTERGTFDTVKEVASTGFSLLKGLGKAAVRPKETISNIKEGFVEGTPTTVAGIQTGISRVAANLEEGIRRVTGIKSETLKQVSESLERKAEENQELSQVLARERMTVQDTRKLKEKLEDPQFLFRDLVGKNAPSLAISMGVGLATGGVGGVAAGAATSFGSAALMEGGSSINEAKEFLRASDNPELKKLADDKDFLDKIGLTVGVVNGVLETLPITRVLNRVQGGKDVKNKIVREAMQQILRKTGSALTQGGAEGVTESLQEIVSNAVAKTYDQNRDIFQGVAEAGIAGLLLGGGADIAASGVEGGIEVGKQAKELYQSQTPAERQAGFAKLPFGEGEKKEGATPDFAKIPQDDLNRVLEFVDNVRNKTGENTQLEIDARRLAELYGIQPEQSNAKLANELVKKIETTEGMSERVLGRGEQPIPVGIDRGGNPPDVEGSKTYKASREREVKSFMDTIATGQEGFNFGAAIPKEEQDAATQRMQQKIKDLRDEQASGTFQKKPLDPFAGSGVTGAEAIKAGRTATLIEKREEVVEGIIKPRLEEAARNAPEQQTALPTKKEMIEKQKAAKAPNLTQEKPKRESRQLIPWEKVDELAKKLQGKVITKEELDEMALIASFLEQSIEEDPMRQLAKYSPRKGEFAGELPEVTGEKGKTIFAQRGDDIITELGFYDTEEARRAFREYRKKRAKFIDVKRKLASMRTDRADIKKVERISRIAMGARRARFRALQNAFTLTDAELAKIRRGRDITAMTASEFDTFMKSSEKLAERIQEETKERTQLEYTIQSKELKGVENLRQVMKLPPINQMSAAQLRQLDEVLSQYKTGDEFFSVRKLETVDKTDLKGIKTLREARERLAQEINVPISQLDNIKVSELDRYRFDTALAERNEFYRLLVEGTASEMIQAEARFLDVEKETDDLFRKARASRSRSLTEKLVPTDETIFKYLESDDATKAEMRKDMTPEEVKAAEFVRESYKVVRDYLIQMKTLEKYRENYVTHIRRGFLETWKDDGLVTAFKEAFQKHAQEEAIFNILDTNTGDVLPLEKFFQFSMRRSGALVPTKNVSRAFLSYMRAFQRKVALDAIVPKLDIYTHSLTPKMKTPRGLDFDRSLKRFVNEWVNTKKGRTAPGYVKQGGRIDWALRTMQHVTYLHDLALNIPIGIASQFGEQATTFTLLGGKKYARGIARLATKQGRAVIDKHESFVGKSPWAMLHDTSKNAGEKFSEALFGLYRDATVRANKIFFLGSLTDAEFNSGRVDPRRLAALRTELGRYRVVENAESIKGATTEGKILKQYKSWAIPPLRTTLNNITELSRMVASRKNVVGTREAQELFRSILIIGSVGLVTYAIASDDDDDSFTSKLRDKALRDAMTVLGSLDPRVILSVPRLATFLEDFGTAVADLVTLAEYKDGSLKGARELFRVVEPAAIKQVRQEIMPEEKASRGTGTGSSMPSLPALPKLPKLPSF